MTYPPSCLHRLRSSRGQALVELALLLPILLLLIFGVIEFGRAFYMKNTLTNAVRHAARKAAVNTSWNQTSIRFWTYSAVPGSWRSASVITLAQSSPASPPASGSGADVTVTAKLKFTTIVPHFYFPFKNYTTIAARATMRYEQ
ncbi:pilus assembly protein [Geobacter sp. FeAm09]|uniref:TadE/TadG family type IV pilus assembly protein n=1 Tax=Geobacter sp. FeAm09 TaxID=2597769 RepID=UPI0011EFC82B|nr:TadE family protein [Geobacter sp. FeAm09]QEM68883.1 pilus assembly protein [Geobacter sp. FeAm09]